jgi:hypothetical protein
MSLAHPLHSFLNAAHLMTGPNSVIRKRTRRDFISIAGKSLGLAALSSATIGSLLRNVEERRASQAGRSGHG